MYILTLYFLQIPIKCDDSGAALALADYEIHKFLDHNTEDEGYVVKLPFTTNKHGRYFCKTRGKRFVFYKL